MDELQSKVFWHLLPNCSNSLLLSLQDVLGALPHPKKLTPEQRDRMPEPLVQNIARALGSADSLLSQRLEYASDYIYTNGLCLVERGTAEYPSLLAQIPDAPALLYVLGDIEQLHKPQVAIVGSRRCSRSGQRDAKDFARFMAQKGFGITSGLAIGIDTAAHLGALEAEGLTSAVIGSGLDNIYPAKNRLLASQIVESGGTIVSEFAPGMPPMPENFPKRNRIISGLSLASLIVEASERSGSLITARLALEQGREVLVLPGSIHDPLKRGCHRLIRDGATLVSSADHIVEQLGSLLGFQLEMAGVATEKSNVSQELDPRHPPMHTKVLSNIEFESICLDDLLELTGLQTQELVEILTDLELQGVVLRGPEGIKRLQ